MGYIDLHTHSLFSDGVLIASELVYRAKVRDYEAIAVTDHGDFSTIDFILPRVRKIASALSSAYGLRVLAGIEITYVPPAAIAQAVRLCRRLKADIVVVHGETPAETVPPGTNRAAINAGADVLAHPGYITPEDAAQAAALNVALEITTRRGHRDGNRHVARLAKKCGARLVMNTDTHAPENLMTPDIVRATLKLSGLSMNDFAQMQSNARGIIHGRTRPSPAQTK